MKRIDETEGAGKRALERLRNEAVRLGFLRLGVADAAPAESMAPFRKWIELQRHGSMSYLEQGSDVRADIRRFMPGTRSVVVMTAAYESSEPPSLPHEGPAGIIARYGRSKDYHKGLRRSIVALARLSDRISRGSRSRIFLDTAPVLEREWAVRAGLGWIGKNGCLIDPDHGSWILIGGFVTSAELPASTGLTGDQCGDCRRCLDACPTNAFPEPGRLDATRCLSYMTIEHRGVLGEKRLLEIGERIFGCDICQEVCPWNAREGTTIHPSLRARENIGRWPLSGSSTLTAESFDREFAGTPVRRPGFLGFARSVAASLATLGTVRDLPALESIERESRGEPGVVEAVRLARLEIERKRGA